MMKQALIAAGSVTLAVALALLPTLSASAAVRTSTTGKAPHSALCTAYHSLGPIDVSDAAAVDRAKTAIEAGDWSKAKTAYLTAFGGQTREDTVLRAATTRSPRNIRSAVTTLLTYARSIQALLKKSDTASQFASAGSSLVKNPKLPTSENTLAKYLIGQCGSSSAS